MRTGELDSFLSLVHRRWNIPILAELHRRSGAKFVTLVNHLGVSRASLSSSLDDLVALGLVRRNTGHGHPMRPEYLLTSKGTDVGLHCAALTSVLREDDETDLAFRKWTLPLVVAIGEDSVRFNELLALLRHATPRALTIGLKALLETRWASRRLIDDYPPTAGYQLMPRGRRILACIDPLLAPV